MSQAIRSEADKQIISLCCRILLNLARYRPTQSNVFQVNAPSLQTAVTISSLLRSDVFLRQIALHFPDSQFRNRRTDIVALV